jgi:Na+/H+-dicarboxylate symporter
MFNRLSLPVQLLLVIIFVVLCGSYLPEIVIRSLYTFSVLFKDLLQFFLPFVIFAFVLSGIVSFKKNAPLVLLVLTSSIFLSNAFVAFLTYGVAKLFLPVLTCNANATVLAVPVGLQPLFHWSIPPLIRSEKVLLATIVIGSICSWFRIPHVKPAVDRLKRGIEWVLAWIFIPLLPLYVLGFLLKITYEGMLPILFQHYGATVILIVALQITYLAWFYFVACGFSLQKAGRAIQIALPSYITAFSTMSSTATIPVTVQAAQKNTHNPSLSLVAMPIMANVHLLGDSISTPLLALVSLVIFKGCIPSFFVYCSFIFYFCMTMFAVSGLPGGGILVMIPILTTQLGFTPDMISVIMTLYFLLDSFGTAANVMGDGALVILVNKFLKRLGIHEE